MSLSISKLAAVFRQIASLRAQEQELLLTLATIYERGVDAHAAYSQLDGQRPPGCGKTKYLRAHRRAVRGGESGAWSEGRARLMTPECWTRLATTDRPATDAPPAAPTAEMDRQVLLWLELGVTPAHPTAEQRAAMVAMDFDRRMDEAISASALERSRRDAANAKRTATKRARYGPRLRRT